MKSIFIVSAMVVLTLTTTSCSGSDATGKCGSGANAPNPRDNGYLTLTVSEHVPSEADTEGLLEPPSQVVLPCITWLEVGDGSTTFEARSPVRKFGHDQISAYGSDIILYIRFIEKSLLGYEYQLGKEKGVSGGKNYATVELQYQTSYFSTSNGIPVVTANTFDPVTSTPVDLNMMPKLVIQANSQLHFDQIVLQQARPSKSITERLVLTGGSWSL